MRVFVAGHRGLVGSEIAKSFRDAGHLVITRDRKDLDLQDFQGVRRFFSDEGLDGVILAAAKVGGIVANKSSPVEFLVENLQIQTSVILAAAEARIENLIFLSSSCVYPRITPQPMHPDQLMSGHLEKTNESYALAKLTGMRLIDSVNEQFQLAYASVLPTNVYGLRDNFVDDNAHVLPALIRKIYSAKLTTSDSVTLWGTGTPLREFIHARDLASAVLTVFEATERPSRINIGTGEEVTISALATMIAEELGFSGQIVWDDSMPDGTPRKLLDSSFIKGLGWNHQTSLKAGVKEVISHYIGQNSVR